MKLSVCAVVATAGLVLMAAGPKPSAPHPGSFRLKSTSVVLPPDDVQFPGANADAVNANCLACHSASMTLAQPKRSAAEWTETVHKMQTAFKAPIEDDQVPAIVAYLSGLKPSK